MEKQKNKNNIIYIVIAVLTLMVAITGATFAYYTATSTVNNVITGNMATIRFNISVTKKTNVDNTRGLIPMTNSMVQKAVANASTKGICLDDNGNAVCQVYKITINNSSTAGMYFDGYVTLTGGSGVPTDYTTWGSTTATTMRWAQAFCTETSGNLASCTTAGTSTARQTDATGFTWTALGSNTSSQLDKSEIIDAYASATKSATIQGNPHTIINKNFIRVSKHTGTGYVQATDITSALVYNQFLSPKDASTANDTGDSSTT
ncbi:MAG: SipW-dependent-type signal peptide-containing protein, partial [Bacilli bacterium]|nr:SipW-dependent-type signal peptide-containing protein [Bacilli bacterium]